MYLIGSHKCFRPGVSKLFSARGTLCILQIFVGRNESPLILGFPSGSPFTLGSLSQPPYFRNPISIPPYLRVPIRVPKYIRVPNKVPSLHDSPHQSPSYHCKAYRKTVAAGRERRQVWTEEVPSGPSNQKWG